MRESSRCHREGMKYLSEKGKTEVNAYYVWFANKK